MTHNPSRKQFFAKMFGSAAALTVLPKLVSKTPASATANGDVRTPAAPVVVRSEARAVARRADTV